MNPIAPGTFLWLLRHEMRVSWRSLQRADRKRSGVIVLAIMLLVIMGLVSIGGVVLGRGLERHPIQADPLSLLFLDLMLLLLWTLMLSQTLAAATFLFFQRGDLDLLLSSPIPAKRVLAVRTLALSAAVLPFIIVILSPLIVPAALIANPAFLAIYPVLFLLSVTAGVAGVWIAMGLFAAIGPRRTRAVAQILAAFIGAVMFLIGQGYNMVGRERTTGLMEDIRAFAHSGQFHADGWAAIPARAAIGELVPLLILAAVTAAVFFASINALGRRFAINAAAASGAAERAPAKAGRDTTRFTGTPFQVLVRKELRLLVRDPSLLSQLLLQMLYLSPIAFVLLRDAGAHLGAAIGISAGGVVFLAGQLAGTLGWITISGEESPELLSCAPVTPGRVRRAKVVAVLIPAFILLGIPLVGLTVFNPAAGLITAAGCAVCAASTTLIELWRQRPGKRTEFRRRRGSAVWVPLVESLVGLCFGAATGLAIGALLMWWLSIAAVILLLVGLGIVYATKPSSAAKAAILAA